MSPDALPLSYAGVMNRGRQAPPATPPCIHCAEGSEGDACPPPAPLLYEEGV